MNYHIQKSTQKLSKETLERVRNHGRMGQSFEKALNKLLDEVEEKEIKIFEQFAKDIVELTEHKIAETKAQESY